MGHGADTTAAREAGARNRTSRPRAGAQGGGAVTAGRREWLARAGSLGLGLALTAGAPRAARRGLVALGCVTPLTGPHAAGGVAVKEALEAAVAEHNAQADARLPELALTTLDDAGDAQRSVAQATRLRTEQEVAALLCPFGAVALRQLMPWAQEQRVPIVGPRSGSDVQRQLHRWTFFTVASSLDQVEVLARHLNTLGVRSLGAMFAADAGGTEAWQHLFTATRNAGMKVVRAETLPADPRALPNAVRAVLGASPEVVVLLAGGAPGVQAARALVDAGWSAKRLYAGAALDPAEVQAALGPAAEGMAFVQVLPSPDDPQDALAAAYRRSLGAVVGARPSITGLEAYLSAQVLLRALRAVKGPATGEALAESLEQGRYALGAMNVAYDKTQHRGSRVAQMALLSGGRLRR